MAKKKSAKKVAPPRVPVPPRQPSLSSDFVSMDALYQAYRKAKVDVFYERSQPLSQESCEYKRNLHFKSRIRHRTSHLASRFLKPSLPTISEILSHSPKTGPARKCLSCFLNVAIGDTGVYKFVAALKAFPPALSCQPYPVGSQRPGKDHTMREIRASSETPSAAERDYETFTGHVRRINFEAIGNGRERKLVCSAFVEDGSNVDVQVYTDNPRLEAALVGAYSSVYALAKKPNNVEIHYAKDGDDLILLRVDLLESSRPDEGVLEERITYNRSAALAYARDRWSRVSSDNYVGIKSSPGYLAVPVAATFVRTTASDPGTEVARRPSLPDIPISELEDCAHFVSCCIGQPPGGGAGGLPIGRDFPSAIYGRISARRLYHDLKDNGMVSVVGGERISLSAAATRLANNELAAGDLIFYYFHNSEPGHAALYLAGAEKRIACHTYCRCDQSSDYNQSWDGVSAASHVTLAKVI